MNKYKNCTGFEIDLSIKVFDGDWTRDITLQDGETVELLQGESPDLKETPVYCDHDNCQTWEENGNFYHECKKHGGKRVGSGAKKRTPDGVKRVTRLLTDAEVIEVDKLIKEMRR